MNKLVILARDGVINGYHGQAIASADAWSPIPGSLEAIARLNQAGYRVAVATNQPGLGSGEVDLDALNAIHHKLHDELDRLGGHVDAIAYCPHPHSADCGCRKPAPTMFRQLGERFGVPVENITVIGDKTVDLQAAEALGARWMLVRTGRGDATVSELGEGGAPVFDDLGHAISALLVEN